MVPIVIHSNWGDSNDYNANFVVFSFVPIRFCYTCVDLTFRYYDVHIYILIFHVHNLMYESLLQKSNVFSCQDY